MYYRRLGEPLYNIMGSASYPWPQFYGVTGSGWAFSSSFMNGRTVCPWWNVTNDQPTLLRVAWRGTNAAQPHGLPAVEMFVLNVFERALGFWRLEVNLAWFGPHGPYTAIWGTEYSNAVPEEPISVPLLVDDIPDPHGEPGPMVLLPIPWSQEP